MKKIIYGLLIVIGSFEVVLCSTWFLLYFRTDLPIDFFIPLLPGLIGIFTIGSGVIIIFRQEKWLYIFPMISFALAVFFVIYTYIRMTPSY